MNRKLTAILNEASFAPKRTYLIYFYYVDQIESLVLNLQDKQDAITLLQQILALKIEDKDVCSNRY